MDVQKEYELVLGRSTKLEERRGGVTTTYLSVNTLICTVIAFLVRDGKIPGDGGKVAVGALIVAGIVTTYFWRAVINQISRLIGHWYKVARQMEDDDKCHPCSKIVNMEYEALYKPETGRKELGLSGYETGLAWLFTALYVAFLLGGVYSVVHEKITNSSKAEAHAKP